jgi:hypothetical protein
MPEGANITFQEQVEQVWNPEVQQRIMDFAYAPMDHPDLLPTLMPLIMGGIIMELYFGKHKKESLGWNTSVGNAIIWMATGITLLMSETLSQPELYATYFLIGLGGFVTFMDFFHLWPSTVAFVISSSAVVYTLAYTLVLIVKTSEKLTNTTMIAAFLFFVGVNVAFKFIQSLETDNDGFTTQI